MADSMYFRSPRTGARVMDPSGARDGWRAAVFAACGLLLLPAAPALATAITAAPAPAQNPAAAQNPAPASGPDSPVTSGEQFASAGVMPRHIPPNLFGRIDAINTGRTGFSVMAAAPAGAAGASVKINLPTYASIYRISRIDAYSLQRGDSVLVQGQSTGDSSFNAFRVIRSSKKIPLGPGIVLADGAQPAETAQPAPAPSGAPAAAVPPVQGAGAPQPAAVPGAPLRKQAGGQAAKRLERAIRRGALPGEVVSTRPLVVELYNGQLWTVNLAQGVPVLDQTPAAAADLTDGSIVKVTGSETAPGAFRASEVDMLSPGLTLRELAGGPGQNALRRLRRR